MFSDDDQVLPLRRGKKTVYSDESDDEVEIVAVNIAKPVVKKKKGLLSEDKRKPGGGNRSDKPAAVKPIFDGNRQLRCVCSLTFSIMLTLDRMTLFFFTLSQSYLGKAEPGETAMVSHWASTIPAGSRPRTTTGSNASTPTLTSGRTGTSRTQLSTHSSLSNNVKVISGSEVVPDSDDEGPVSDRDETNGAERDFAAMSLPTGKGKRAASKVCCTLPPFLQHL